MTRKPAPFGSGPSNDRPAHASVSLSRNSIAVEPIPLPTTRRIASQPEPTSRWNAATGNVASGAGSSRSQAAVTIPSVPSEPINRLFRS